MCLVLVVCPHCDAVLVCVARGGSGGFLFFIKSTYALSPPRTRTQPALKKPFSRYGMQRLLCRRICSSPPPRVYPAFITVSSRWNDNDAFGHVNNAVYYSYVDTAVNSHLIANGVTGKRFLAQSSCRYIRPLAYPQDVDIGLSITKLGTSSATYALGIFSRPAASIEGPPRSTARELCAEATYTHVYVDDVGRPMAMLDHTRRVLEKLMND